MEKLRRLGKRILTAVIVGTVLTLLSMAITGFNLSRKGVIEANDAVNQYFDTCVGNAFGSGTPLIKFSDRGFPLSFVTNAEIPVCDNRVAIKSVKQTSVDAGAVLANVLFWSVVVFWVVDEIRDRRAGKKSGRNTTATGAGTTPAKTEKDDENSLGDVPKHEKPAR